MLDHEYDLIFLETITPLHVGCGQDIGVVDLPVIRERTTDHPFIPGSGLRGALRARCESPENHEVTDLLFGPAADGGNAPEYAGCLAVHDAHLLLFPVRSDREVFLWLTCPFAVARLARLAKAFGCGGWDANCGHPGDEGFIGPGGLGSPVSLEEFSYRREGRDEEAQSLAAWANQLAALLDLEDLASRAVLVSDHSFHYFVRHATAVAQHNRLDSAKTVEEGGLFSVEAVPPAAVFFGLIGATRPRRQHATDTDDAPPPSPPDPSARPSLPQTATAARARLWERVAGEAAATYLQLGGHESTGMGVTRLVRARPPAGDGQ